MGRTVGAIGSRLTLIIGFMHRPRRYRLQKRHAIFFPELLGGPAEQRREDGLAHVSVGPEDLIHPEGAE